MDQRNRYLMAKLFPDIAGQLAANITSPTVIADIDDALAEIDQQREELVSLRKWALRRHQDVKPANILASPSLLPIGAEGGHETVASLIARYKDDPSSPLHKLQFRTRLHYERLMQRVTKEIGGEAIGTLTKERLIEAHAAWAAPGTVSMANSLIVMLRILATYGASDSNNRACRELKMNLQDLRFERPEQQSQSLTKEQADLIIAKAHEMGHHSIAFAQAFQTDCGLRQKDVIGDWVPFGEAIESNISDGELKWVSGLLWSEIDSKLMLRHPPSNGGKLIELDLNDYPRVIKELRRNAGLLVLPRKGPVIVQEAKQLPWRPNEFRRFWRKVANEVGIPKDVKNGA